LAVTKVVYYIGGASTIRAEATIPSLMLRLHMFSLNHYQNIQSCLKLIEEY